MKWIWALAIGLSILRGISPVRAEVLTEANMPKFDSKAACEAWAARNTAYDPPEHRSEMAEFETGNCLNLVEKESREGLLGKDVPEMVIRYCELDARLHNSPGPYSTFDICINEEPARQNLLRAKEWLGMRSSLYCSHMGEALPDDSGYKIRQACDDREKQVRLEIVDNPTRLKGSGFDRCLNEIKSRGVASASWQLLYNCVSRTN